MTPPIRRQPSPESSCRLTAAARLLTAAAEGRWDVHSAADGARRLIDRALDAEAGVLEVPFANGSAA